MTLTEFYEKYWRVDGKEPPPLDPREKAIWDAAHTLGVAPYIKVWRGIYGWVYIVNPIVQEEIDRYE